MNFNVVHFHNVGDLKKQVRGLQIVTPSGRTARVGFMPLLLLFMLSDNVLYKQRQGRRGQKSRVARAHRQTCRLSFRRQGFYTSTLQREDGHNNGTG
jgi:hypothetical protein